MAATIVGVGTEITNIPNDGVTTRSVSGPGGTSIAQDNLIIANFGILDHVSSTVITGGSGTWARITPGYTLPQNFNDALDRWWKIAGASEPISYSVKCNGTSSNGNSTCQIEVWTGTDLTSPINIAAVSAAQNGVTSVVAPGVTTTVANCGISVFVVEINQHASTLTANSPLTLQANNSAGPVATALAYNQAGVAQGAVTPGTLTASVAHDFYAMTVAIAPPAPVPTAGGNATEGDDAAAGGDTPGTPSTAGGNATEDSDTAAGGLLIVNTATVGGNATEGGDSAAGGAGPYIGTILTEPLGEWSLADQSAYANLLISNVHIIRLSTGLPWLQLTNQTTDSQRRLLLQSAQLVKDEWFLIVPFIPNAGLTSAGAKAFQAS